MKPKNFPQRKQERREIALASLLKRRDTSENREQIRILTDILALGNLRNVRTKKHGTKEQRRMNWRQR